MTSDYCNEAWEQPTRFGTLHHFCQYEKGHTDINGHASAHGCVTCGAMNVTFDFEGVKFIEPIVVVDKEVPC